MGKYLDMIRQHEGTQPIETVKAEEALKPPQALDPIPNLHPGDRIAWGADGTPRGPATVDFLHTDPDGTSWAFVTLPDGWAAVNTKYIIKTEGG